MRRAMMVVAGVVALVMAAVIAAYLYARPLVLTGTGYAAHNACAVSFIADRDDAAADLPQNPLVPYLHTSIDWSLGVADATLFGLLAPQRAWFTTGYGCTLSDERPLLPSVSPLQGVTHYPNPPSPDADVAAALAAGFGDDLAAEEKERLGTRAIVVLREGELVAERYAPGFDASTPQLGWSLSKSVTNLLVGRLVSQQTVALTDDHLRPEWSDERAQITIDDLLRMTSGLAWDETYDLGTPITEMLYGQSDMAGFVAGQPLAFGVGQHQQYSSGSTNLLCSVLAQRAGLGADLPARELFEPLGVASAVWEPDAVGTPVCSSYLWATPRDWATLGQLALTDGVWRGERLLPDGWMDASTTVQPVASAEDPNYAAGWWTNRGVDGRLVEPDLPDDAYWAQGHDGQRLYVVPSEGLVVVRLGFSPATPDLRTSALVRSLIEAAKPN